MGGRREDRLVSRLWESLLSQVYCKDAIRRVNLAKKKGLTVTQQSLCMMGQGGLDSLLWEGGGERHTFHW